MPDSLYTHLQSQIDSLVSKTDVIFEYVQEQGKDPEFRLNIVGIIGVILLVLIIAKHILITHKEKRWAIKILKILGLETNEEHRNDRRRSYIELACWLLVVSVLFAFGLIHNFSQAELLFTIALIFTIVGAFWSVFSRIESSKAFKQSEKTYNSFGSTFDFTSFFEGNRLPEVYNRIEKMKNAETEVEVFLYIGFPIVGLPYVKKEKLGNNPEKLFKTLIRGIEDIKDSKKQVNCILNIGVFTLVDSIKILNAIPNIDENKRSELTTRLEYFDNLVKKRKASNKNNNEVVRFIEIDFKEKFRFVTIKDLNSGEKKSFVWVVDLKEGIDGKPKPFENSMVFQTKEERFLNLLEDIFTNRDKFSKEELKKIGLNNRQIKAIQFVREKRKITNSEYQTINKCKPATANKDLTELVQKNIFLFNDIAGAEANYQLKIIASQVENPEVPK